MLFRQVLVLPRWQPDPLTFRSHNLQEKARRDMLAFLVIGRDRFCEKKPVVQGQNIQLFNEQWPRSFGLT